MASDREIVRVMRNSAEAAGLAQQLLRTAGFESDHKDLVFLESIAGRLEAGEPLTTRQAEWLLDIRDRSVWVSTVGPGLSVRLLTARIWQARHELDEGDEEWAASLWQSGATSIRKADAGRLLRLAHRVGEAEHEAA